MNKLIEIIDNLEREDLLKIKMDLEEGNLKRIIEYRLGVIGNDNKVCPVCSKKISSSDYKLEFGKVGLRMRASFDGIDCLQHFVNQMGKKEEMK